MIKNKSYYYDSTGSIFESKYDAVINFKNELFYYYYDYEFSKIDWTIEPDQSLEVLYKERAQQIRDEYDYVILAYSGGVDSTNVLESFYLNNIKIDEIKMVGAFAQDDNRSSDVNHNLEIYKNCFETLRKLNLKDTKITLHDYSLMLTNPNNFSFTQQDDWYKKIGARYALHHWFWYDLGSGSAFADSYSQGKKTALVFGIDKPVVLYDLLSKKFTFQFVDNAANIYGLSKMTNNQNYERVYFYWHPLASTLLRKQVHTVKKYLEDTVLTKPSVSFALDFYFQNRERLVGEQVYNLRHPLNFVSQKSKSMFFSIRDRFLFEKNNIKELDVIKSFDQGQLNMKQSGFADKNMTVYSKPYFLN